MNTNVLISKINDQEFQKTIKTNVISMLYKKKNVLVVMPTYNRPDKCINVIKCMLSQIYKDFDLLIVDDGSSEDNYDKLLQHVNKLGKKSVILQRNLENIKVAKTLNNGLRYFLQNEYKYFTWISDDNEYYPDFINSLVRLNANFVYTAFHCQHMTKKVTKIDRQYKDVTDLLKNFGGCASFMWSREAVQKIGFYDENIPGPEDYDYLIRTFINVDNRKYSNVSNMKYILHDDCLSVKDKANVSDLSRNIKAIYEVLTKNDDSLKVEISDEDNCVKYDKDQNELTVSKKYENIVEKYLGCACQDVGEIKNVSKISIVIVHYNRKEQTINTLNSFEKLYVGKYNFEVIIVDDDSNEENKLNEIIKKYSFSINLIVISEEEKGDRISSGIAYNKGFIEAKGEIIIIQSSECYHENDIIGYTMNSLKEQECINYNNYCFALFKSKLNLIGGFDKRFVDGYLFENEEILLTIKYCLKLNVHTIETQDIMHQKCDLHYDINDEIIKNKILKNKHLYEKIKKTHEKIDFVYPKLIFLYWDGSPLSYLNYLTVESFNSYNPEWKIIVFVPNKRTETISWKTNEQKIKYDKKCYFYKLYNIYNVVINKICLDKIGFKNNASEVIKSDYFRYYILKNHGGIWSDFDIIYTANIEEKMNFKENTIIFRCIGYHDTNNKANGTFTYYPIGFFLSKPDSLFFKYILQNCNKYYDKNSYQCIGATMFNDLFKKKNNVFSIDPYVKILNNEYYLPWHCNELEYFLKQMNNTLPMNNVGIHWFNGGEMSKQYSISLEDRINNFSIQCYLDKHVEKYLNENRIALFSESSYPGGGGEEFLLDVAIYFYNKNYKVYWFTLHEWGKSKHTNYEVLDKIYYTEVKNPCDINDMNNFIYFVDLFKKFNINYLLNQGQGHKLICDIGNHLNIPAITFWCFWEEALNIDWKYGLKEINKNLDKHKKTDDFLYIINNVDYYYFASKFVKNTIENKYNLVFDDEHVFPTLSCDKRFKKDINVYNFNSKYISLLDAHTLKGGVLLSELILLNPQLSFLAIKTEEENEGPNAIKQAMSKVNNNTNVLHYKRINDIKDIYNETKILLCPTQLDETFCRVVYEAFQNKIPVIFSNCGNLKYIDEPNLLKVIDNRVESYNEKIHKLINDKEYYNFIVNCQYNYYLKIKRECNIQRIENKFIEIRDKKKKNIGIFTPWCDQGLGIQSRIYKKLLEDMGFNVFIFSTKPYVSTDKTNLIGNKEEWKTDNIYRSPNRRLETSMLEWDLFVKNYKIDKLIIPEIQYQQIFDIAEYIKQKYRIKTFAIPNVECIRESELTKFDVFEKVFTNNQMTYDILKSHNLKNIEYLGFHYDITDKIKINEINMNKCVVDTINILHLSGLNGLFRKRTDIIVKIFDNIYNQGITNFRLNIVIQGNFDKNKMTIFDKPFIDLTYGHLSYSEILNKYNDNHISIQLSKHEGLGLGFFESCFMNTPVITLNAPPHNEIIHQNKNGWLLSCSVEKDKNPENPFTIIGQTQINELVIVNEIKQILLDKNNINDIIKNTKKYTETNLYFQKSFMSS
jgi:glycosyltransferase involved in cell wall biosynthesis